MKNLLIFVLLVVSTTTYAQKIFVEKTDGGFEQPIIDKLISSNYKLTFKKDSADYLIMCVISKTGMGRATGSIALIDNKTGDLIIKSKEATGQTSLFNGYSNTRELSMQKVADKYLIDCLKRIVQPLKK